MVRAFHAQEQAVVDLKPDNMLVEVVPSGAGSQTLRILLCDFEGFVSLPKVRLSPTVPCFTFTALVSYGFSTHWHRVTVFWFGHGQEGACARAQVWTPEFQAPGWEGKVTHWSDWYALGATIHALLVSGFTTAAGATDVAAMVGRVVLAYPSNCCGVCVEQVPIPQGCVRGCGCLALLAAL